MKCYKRARLVLLLGMVVLTACGEGVVAFSPRNDRIAIVHPKEPGEVYHLYTTDTTGRGWGEVDLDNFLWTFNVSFSPSGDRLLYARGVPSARPGKVDKVEICSSNVRGGDRKCYLTLPSEDPIWPGGALFYLSDERFLIMYEGLLREHRLDGTRETLVGEADWYVFPDFAYKEKGARAYTRSYDNPNPEQGVCWLMIQDDKVFRHTFTTDIERSDKTLRVLDDDILTRFDCSLLGTSPDCTKLIIRTNQAGAWCSGSRDLYVLDLTASSEPVKLVSGAGTVIGYAFSPSGARLAYTSNADGGSVWITRADGTYPQKLADDAELFGWNWVD